MQSPEEKTSLSIGDASARAAPRMMTIRQVASTGVLPENAIRTMVKQNTIPHVMVGTKALINYDKLLEMLKNL